MLEPQELQRQPAPEPQELLPVVQQLVPELEPQLPQELVLEPRRSEPLVLVQQRPVLEL